LGDTLNKCFQLILLFSIGFSGPQWENSFTGLLSPGRHEIGLFSSFRMGLNNGSEISVNKFLLLPNVSYKTELPRFNNWEMAYGIQVAYPTIAMRWLQSPLGMKLGEPDMFALISPEFTIPQMLSVYGEIMGTKGTPLEGLLSINGGLGIGLNGKGLAQRATIDLPIIYPRLSVYYNGLLIKVGSDYFRQLKGRWFYMIDYDMFFMPGGDGRFAFEHKGLLVWSKNEKFRILFGYKLVAGEYPYGSQAHLFPAVDFQFGW